MEVDGTGTEDWGCGEEKINKDIKLQLIGYKHTQKSG